MGSKFSAVEVEQIKQLVASGVYLNTSNFVRDAIRDKLAAIKTIKYRDIDYNTAKKEVMGYFQERGEAYPSEVEEDPELDYELVCQITEELERGPPGAAMTDCCEAEDALHGYRIRAEARKVSDPRVIAKSGRHKARRIILTENAGAVIERKLDWKK